MSAFGSMVLPHQVEQGILSVFQTWMDTYLREMERRTSRDGNSLPSIRNWAVASHAEQRFPEQQLPGVQLTWDRWPLDGHADDVGGQLTIGGEVLVQSTNFNSVHDLAGVYVFALGLIVMHKVRRHPLVSSVTVPELALPTVAGSERRWRAVGTFDFAVTVNGVMDLTAEPEETFPTPDPVPGDAPTVAQDAAVATVDLQSP